MGKPKIYFRADGNSQIGLGHVIRSLALAEMLNDLFECHFIIRQPLTTLKEQILEVCNSILELPETADPLAEAQEIALRLQTSDIVVLDGYHFRTAYQQVIKDRGCKLVCIDDIYAHHFVADVVINHAPVLDKEHYSIEPYTKLCLGLDYSLLRKPFLEAATQERIINNYSNIFICFGGVDLNNNSLKAMQDLDNYAPIKNMQVVIGAANPYKDAIISFAKKATTPIDIASNVSAEILVKIMKKCQIAIVPASTILYELSCVKMPIISGYYVDNQKNICKGFDSLGLIKNIGNFNTITDYKQVLSSLTPKERTLMLTAQKDLQKGESLAIFRKLFTNLIPS